MYESLDKQKPETRRAIISLWCAYFQYEVNKLNRTLLCGMKFMRILQQGDRQRV